MITVLNAVVDMVESQLATDPSADVDVAAVAARAGTTEHHLRRMFASLAGMPVSEYVRRRRMSAAAALVTGSTDDLLGIAVRFGYGLGATDVAHDLGRAWADLRAAPLTGVYAGV